LSWLYLIAAGLFEVGFATCLGKAKMAEGHAILFWYVAFLFCLAASMLLLVQAIKVLPIGTAYAVWTGIGTAGTVLVGILLFNEPADLWRLFFITTLLASIIGLKVVTV
jgi:quaternary ammonium compound-resistance protein SugE